MMLEMDLAPDKLVGDKFISKPAPKFNLTLDKDLSQKYSLQISLLVSLKPGLEMLFNVGVGVLVDRWVDMRR